MKVVIETGPVKSYVASELVKIVKTGDIVQVTDGPDREIGTIIMITDKTQIATGSVTKGVALSNGSTWAFLSEDYTYIVLNINKMTLS